MITGERKTQTLHFACLKKGKETYELIINPEQAIAFKKGKINDINQVLKFEEIYSNAKKGLVASDLNSVFKTNNILEIAKEILLKGEIKLTTEYKKKLQDKRRKEIINIICSNGIDPRNNLPIPPSRVELALERVKFNFDPFKNVNSQVEELVDKLRPILPISFTKKELQVLVPAKFAGKVKGMISNLGKIIKSNWNSDGSFNFNILVPGGLVNEIINKLNNISHGQSNIKIIKGEKN